MSKKIQILIDPSHKNWVLGGLFQEVASSNPDFFLKPKLISNIRSKYVIQSFITTLYLRFFKNPILFSSVTPLINYLKMVKFDSSIKILWFTHQYGDFSNELLSTLRKVNLILVHSKKEATNLIKLGLTCPIIPLVGAIEPSLFRSVSTSGSKIAFIGTITTRKNVEILFNFIKLNPHLEFKILGKNWKKHQIWQDFEKLVNVEYSEINKRVHGDDLKDCSHHLILSEVEGGPISLIESVASGLVPVSTRTGIAEEFLSECGYQAQLLDFPLDFNSIKIKLNYSYSDRHRMYAAELAKGYSTFRFAKNIKVEIDKVLNSNG